MTQPTQHRFPRILVTGGSGFLGRAIVATARQQGYEVLAPRSNEFDLVTGAGLDTFMTAATRTGPVDAVIHSAAYYGGIGINVEQPATIFDRNTRMTLSVFELARRFAVRKVLPIGSACAYPGHFDAPMAEDDFWSGPLHESVEAYGFSKKIQMVGQRAYYKQYGIEGNHLILSNLYGPHDIFDERRSHVLAALIQKFVDATDQVTLWGDGSPVREFIYVQDAAEAIVLALDLPHDLEPINIGTGVPTPVWKLAALIADEVGFSGEIIWDTTRPNGSQFKVLDVTRMMAVLPWKPRYDLARGLRKTITWYRENNATTVLLQ
jgi:GDP-L-fucose synthase